MFIYIYRHVEGVNAWVAANYVNDASFQSLTSGIVEMGGSSLQIAFALSGGTLRRLIWVIRITRA